MTAVKKSSSYDDEPAHTGKDDTPQDEYASALRSSRDTATNDKKYPKCSIGTSNTQV